MPILEGNRNCTKKNLLYLRQAISCRELIACSFQYQSTSKRATHGSKLAQQGATTLDPSPCLPYDPQFAKSVRNGMKYGWYG